MIGREALARRGRVLLGLPRDVVLYLPLVLRVRRGMRETKDVSALLRSLTPATPVTIRDRSIAARTGVVRSVLRLTRFLRVNPKGDCLLRSLALYAALRRGGWPAVFVTGLRREPSGVVGHAWVELDGRVLEELKEPGNRARYRESFRYPPLRAGGEYSRAAAGAALPG